MCIDASLPVVIVDGPQWATVGHPGSRALLLRRDKGVLVVQGSGIFKTLAILGILFSITDHAGDAAL